MEPDKHRHIVFTFDERSLRTREQWEAEGWQFVKQGDLTIPVYAPQPPVSGRPLSTPQLDTPYARLTQALADHRLALTGTDLEEQCNAVAAIHQLAWAEWNLLRVRCYP